MFANKNRRPILKIPYTGYEIALWAMALLGIAVGFLLVLEYWAVIPDAPPIHFGTSGNADGEGDRSLLLVIPVTAFLISLGAAVFSHYTHRFNLIVPITKEAAKLQYIMARRLILWVNMESVWVLAFLEWNLIDAGLGNPVGHIVYFIPVVAVAVVATIGYYVYQLLISR